MLLIKERIRNQWIEQIKKIAHPISKDKDFSFIDPYIKNKRIILLGESDHEAAEYQSIKINLIQYLHQKHNFNVVVLESGLIEATLCNTFLKDYSIEKQIQHTLLGIYQTREMVPLFEEEWTKTLNISGMDVQTTVSTISEHVLKWIKKHLYTEIYEAMERLEHKFFELDMQIQFKVSKSLRPKIKGTIEEYRELLIVLDKELHSRRNLKNKRMLQIIRRGMLNRLQWLEVCLKGYISSGVLRDKYMFNNLEWLIDELYQNEKIIIWAHNFHIRRGSSLTSRLLKIKTSGEWLYEKYNQDVYSIGLYACNGKMADYRLGERAVKKLDKSYLEWLLNQIIEDSLFMHISDLRQENNDKMKNIDKTMWYHRKWFLLESGRYPKRMYPQNEYDALIFVKKIHPAIYLN